MTNKVWTIPNIISMFRLILVFVFAYYFIVDRPVLAILVLAVSGVSDFIDGVIARRFNQISRLGQVLDPLADRVFILIALILSMFKGVLPIWFVTAILLRDIVLAVMYLIGGAKGYRMVPVNFIGKIGTASLYFSIPVLFLSHYFAQLEPFCWPIGWAMAMWGVICYWISGYSYMKPIWNLKS